MLRGKSKKLHNTRLVTTRLTAIILNISLKTSFKTKALSLGLNAKPWNEKKKKIGNIFSLSLAS